MTHQACNRFQTLHQRSKNFSSLRDSGYPSRYWMNQGATQSLEDQLRKRWTLGAYLQLNSGDLSRDLDILWSASRVSVLSLGCNLNREYCEQNFQKFGYPVTKNNIRLAYWKEYTLQTWAILWWCSSLITLTTFCSSRKFRELCNPGRRLFLAASVGFEEAPTFITIVMILYRVRARN